MAIDNLPILDDPLIWPLKVVERAEIIFKDRRRHLAYVAGKTKNGLYVVYDYAAGEIDGELVLLEPNSIKREIEKIKMYIVTRPVLELVKGGSSQS